MVKGTPRVILLLSYSGTFFKGFQYQKRGRSVQGEIEKAIEKINFKGRIYGCSRTDGGVHSRNYISHFKDTLLKRSAQEIFKGLNANLPDDIRVYSVAKTSDDFHARYSTLKKTYRYFLYLSDSVPPPIEPYLSKFRNKLDISRMKDLPELIVGKHSFKVFTTKEGREAGVEREVDSFAIYERLPLLVFEIEGKSFLHRMVRFIVSMIINYSAGKIDIDFVKDALRGNLDYLPFPAVEAKGLHLWDVKIEDFTREDEYAEFPQIPLYPFESLKLNLIKKATAD